MSCEHCLPVGFKLEQYTIQKDLGAGGFGVVYLAHDNLDRKVAIKEFFPGPVAQRASDGINITVRPSPQRTTYQDTYKEGLKRFLGEAKVLAGLKHPNIVEVHEFLEANNTAYLVMEYYTGGTLLQKVLKEGRPEPAWVQQVLNGLLDGLCAVHDKGILHRDVKPENIYLVKDGKGDTRPVLLDFGAARRAVVEGTHSTVINQVFTPGYAALEQYGEDRKAEGAWTDIYGLGAVAYYLITGSPPPAAPDRVGNDRLQPLIGLKRPGYAPGWLASVDKALAVKPDDRYQSIEEWQKAVKPPDKRRWRAALAVLGVIIAIVVGYWQYQKTEAKTQAMIAKAQTDADEARNKEKKVEYAAVIEQERQAKIANEADKKAQQALIEAEYRARGPSKSVELIPEQDTAIVIAYWANGHGKVEFNCKPPPENKPDFEIYGAELSGEMESNSILVGYINKPPRSDIGFGDSIPVHRPEGCNKIPIASGYCDGKGEFCRRQNRAKGCYINKAWYNWYKGKNQEQPSVYRINYDTICSKN